MIMDGCIGMCCVVQYAAQVEYSIYCRRNESMGMDWPNGVWRLNDWTAIGLVILYTVSMLMDTDLSGYTYVRESC